MKQHRLTGLLKAIFCYMKRRSSFTSLQVSYLFHDLLGNREKSKELRIQTLKSYIGLKENATCYLLDDLLFLKTQDDLIDAVIGMCLDIFLKDPFYKLKDESLRENIKENLQFYFYHEGEYEIADVQVCNHDVVIDAGANMGMFSILAAKKGAKVHAFEPQACFFHILNENCRLNAMEDSIHTYPLAISSHNRNSFLSVPRNNLLAASIHIDRRGSIEPVICTSIDHWVKENKISTVDFIKADIEGAERLLLDGAKDTIRRFRPKIAMAIYHLPDDKDLLKRKILNLCSDYIVIMTGSILFAYCRGEVKKAHESNKKYIEAGCQ